MHDVGFQFFGAPVQFESGMVLVEDSGRFRLGVTGVWARDFRLDARLRKIMPPVMAKFAQRLDEGQPLSTIKGNLGLSWSGPDQPVACDWDHVLVVFNDNTIQAGIPLEHIQGQLDHVRGRFDGDHLDVHGALKLDSVSLLGQQVTELESPFHVAHDLAQARRHPRQAARRRAGRPVRGQPRQHPPLRRQPGRPRRRPPELRQDAPRPADLPRPGLRPARLQRPGQRPADPPGPGLGRDHPGRPRRAARRPPAVQRPQARPRPRPRSTRPTSPSRSRTASRCSTRSSSPATPSACWAGARSTSRATST